MNALLRLLARAHALAALVPLVFLAALFAKGVETGFAPSERAYTPIRVDPVQAAEAIATDWLSRGDAPASRVVAFWGLREELGVLPDPDSPSLRLARALLATGARLRIGEPDADGALLARLGSPTRVEFLADPLSACDGATEIVWAQDRPDLREVDLSVCRDRMEGSFLVDCVGAVEPGIFRETRLILLPLYLQKSPPWLENDYQRFVAELREQIPEDEGVLLFPDERIETTNPRSRWYLHLNYALAPRPVHLPLAAGACGTAEQFQDWVGELNLLGPGSDALLRRGLEATGAEWVLRYRHEDDFRRAGWTLQSAEEALR